METIFKHAIELVSDWRCWILPPLVIFVLGATVQQIIGGAQEEIDKWR